MIRARFFFTLLFVSALSSVWVGCGEDDPSSETKQDAGEGEGERLERGIDHGEEELVDAHHGDDGVHAVRGLIPAVREPLLP